MDESTDSDTRLESQYPNLAEVKKIVNIPKTDIVTKLEASDSEKKLDIFEAIKMGNFLPIIALCKLKKGVDLRKLDADGFSAIHYAVCYGNFQVRKV